EANEHARAVDLLVETARLPFEPETSRSMRRNAAEIAAGPLGDTDRAVALYRGVLDEAPSDPRALERLGALYEARKEFDQLLALRAHELGLTEERARRLELRLDIARVHGILDQRDARVSVLEQNLEEAPGHEASVGELTALFEAEGQHETLAKL